MARVKIPLVGPFYESRDLPLSAQVTKNLYPEVNAEAKTLTSLKRFPGLTTFATMSGNDRGLHVMNEVLYAVKGSMLYRVNQDGSTAELGTVPGATRCEMADDGNILMIVTGNTPYIFQNNTVKAITDPDVKNPTTVDYLNGKFIFDKNDGIKGEFSTSQLGAGLTAEDFVDALDSATAESHPDDLLRVITHNQQAYFMGGRTIEPWYDSGAGSPPLQRTQGGVLPIGIAGREAADITDDVIYLLGDDRVPRKLAGIQVLPIGNPAIGAEFSRYSEVGDCVVNALTIDDSVFAIFTFPTANRSWLYHEASNSWSQLADGVGNNRHRIISAAYVYGKTLVGDYENGKVYELDPNAFDNDGNAIQLKRATAAIHGGLYQYPGAELFFDAVHFDINVGVGLTTGQGSDPMVMIRYSDDRGRTWSAENMHPIGQGGNYLRRVSLYQQGSARERIYELTYSEPTQFSLYEAWADVDFSR